MAKTVLKAVLSILVLSGIFFLAIQYFEKYRSEKPQVEEPAAPSVSVRQVSVVTAPQGATVAINDVPGPDYTLVPAADGMGFSVRVPGAGVKMLTSSLANPHEMVSRIDVSAGPHPETPEALIRVVLAGKAMYRDRLVGNTLYLDLVSQPDPTPTPTPERRATTTPARLPQAAATLSPTPRPTPRPTVRPAMAPTATPAPVSDEDPWFSADDFGFGPPLDPEPAPTSVPSTPLVGSQWADVAEEAPTAAPRSGWSDVEGDPLASPGEGETSLDDLFGAPPSSGGDEFAALPPPSPGVFDAKQITKDLPSIRDVVVTSVGGMTTVKIVSDRRPAYKVFRMVNPNRIVVDLRDSRSAVEQMQRGFEGSKVQRIETKEYPGADQSITRVTIFVDGLPEYKVAREGNAIVLRLP